MAKENSGRTLQFSEIFIVCVRCGNLFLPRSRIKHVFEAATIEAKKSEQKQSENENKKPEGETKL
jgi:uncharacterized C2H2 Zn-finger protein